MPKVPFLTTLAILFVGNDMKMGSNSSKTRNRSVGKTGERSTDFGNKDNNMPDVLVSILRQKAVLISEGLSVATQTDDINFIVRGDVTQHSWNTNTVGNGALTVNSELKPNSRVSYDLESSDHFSKTKNEDNKPIEENIAKLNDEGHLNEKYSTHGLAAGRLNNKVSSTVKVQNSRERSDMSTNTTVTAIPGFSCDLREQIEKNKEGTIEETKPILEDEMNENVIDETKSDAEKEDEKSGIVLQKALSGSAIDQPKSENISQIQEDKHECQDSKSTDSPLLERYGKYRVRVESDREKCTISAVKFLDTGDLVLIDRSNKNIKYVDSEFRYISAHSLPAQPWAVCARGVDVYVTIGNTQIQHMYVKDMLIEPERLFEVKGRCLGICIYGEHIAVGLQIGEIHLLDTIGVVQKTIKLPLLDNGKACNPWNLCVSKEQNLLVTDSDAKSVFCINQDSQLVCKFCEMSSPRSATVDCHGNVIVVGRDNESGVVVKLVPRDWELGGILHMEHETSSCKALLTWQDLEFVPYCVDFRQDGILVMGGIRESLKIMKLKN